MNAQPFESGILGLSYGPFYEYNVYLPISSSLIIPEGRLPFLTGLPHVLMNIATQSEVTLSVPYMGPEVFLNLTAVPNFGSFFLYPVVSPSSGASSLSVPFSVYMYFTDVKFYGATVNALPSIFAQGPSSSSKKIGQFKPISGNLNAVAKIPFLKEMAPDVSLGLEAAATFANEFGFCREPLRDDKTVTIFQKPYGQTVNDDLATNVQKLSLSTTQQINLNSFGPTEEDEMTIAKIVKDPQYLYSFNWRTAQNVGDLVAEWPVNPNCTLKTAQAQGPIFGMNRLCFTSQFFMFWRGALRYQLHFASTKFHSGRLRICYQIDTPVTPTVDNAAFWYNEIIDIRDAQIVAFEAPYICTSPWRKVPSRGSMDEPWLKVTRDFQGKPYDNWIRIYVETPLRAPDNVTNTVTAAVFNYAAPDFQLTAPHINKFQTLTTDTLEAAHSPAQDVKDIYAQAPIEDTDSMAVVTPISLCGIGLTTAQNGASAKLFANGEVVKSFRAMLKRYQQIRLGFYGQPNLAIFPWAPPIIPPTEAGASDWLSNIWPMYRFYSGGIRYAIQKNQSAAQQRVAGYIHYYPDINELHDFIQAVTSSAGELGLQTNNANCSMGILVQNVSGTPANVMANPMEGPHAANILVPPNYLTELEFPYYTRWPLMVRTTYNDNNRYQYEYQELVNLGAAPNGVAIFRQIDSNGDVSLFRSIADDFSMSFLLGAPLTQYRSTRT